MRGGIFRFGSTGNRDDNVSGVYAHSVIYKWMLSVIYPSVL